MDDRLRRLPGARARPHRDGCVNDLHLSTRQQLEPLVTKTTRVGGIRADIAYRLVRLSFLVGIGIGITVVVIVVFVVGAVGGGGVVVARPNRV